MLLLAHTAHMQDHSGPLHRGCLLFHNTAFVQDHLGSLLAHPAHPLPLHLGSVHLGSLLAHEPAHVQDHLGSLLFHTAHVHHPGQEIIDKASTSKACEVHF